METQNESSSLIALRALRESDQRRQHEAEQVKAKAEQERSARAQERAREERLAREHAERQAVEAHERAQSTRLGRELDAARSEIAHLRSELAQANLAGLVAAPPLANRARTVGWLGISAGATMLVGALALSAAMQPRARSRSPAETTAPPAIACPEKDPVGSAAVEPRLPPPASSPPPATSKRPAKPHPQAPRRPPASPVPPTVCDGTDPLCGIPSGISDDFGRKPGKRSR